MAFSLRALFLLVVALCASAQSPGDLADLISPCWHPDFNQAVDDAVIHLSIDGSEFDLRGDWRMQQLPVFGDTLYHIYFTGKGTLLLQDPDVEERNLVSAQLETPPVELKVKEVHFFFDPLPAALASQPWIPYKASVLMKSGYQRHFNALRHTGDAHPIIEWLALRSSGGGGFSWARINKKDFVIRSAKGERNRVLCGLPARPGSVLYKPLHHIFPMDVDLTQDPVWIDWPGHAARLDLQVEAIGDLRLDWTASMDLDLDHAVHLFALRLDPRAELNDLRVMQAGLELPCTSWRIKDAGLAATDLPLVIVHSVDVLEGRITIVSQGFSPQDILMEKAGDRETLFSRCWHPAPVSGWIDSCSVEVKGPPQLSWWTTQGRIPTLSVDANVIQGHCTVANVLAPVLHVEGQELLAHGDNIAIARQPLRNRRALEESVRPNVSQWRYDEQSVVSRNRFLLPSSRFERPSDISYGDPNLMNVPDFEMMDQGSDTLAEALLGEDQRVAELRFAFELASLWLGAREGACLFVEEHGEPSEEAYLRSRHYRGMERRFPVGIRDQNLWGNTPEDKLVRLEAVCSIWWQQEVALSPSAPDWFARGLSRACALALMEQMYGWESAAELRTRALNRIASRLTPRSSSSCLLYGDRAEGSWRNQEISDQMAWRFTLILENLRWRLRNGETLDDSSWRDYIRKLARMHHVGPVTTPLDVSRFIEVSDRLLYDLLEDSAADWLSNELHRTTTPVLHLEIGSAQGNTVLRLRRENAEQKDRLYLPVLIQFSNGQQALLTLVNQEDEQAFLLPAESSQISAVTYAPGASVLAEVKDY